MTHHTPTPQIFGIRHHGPGSARSLRHALEQMQPDALLVEGPPDAADVLPLLTHADMQPPVALLVYVPDQPRHAVFYPFAVFSPEWQALHYGLTHGIPVRFMDLPQIHQLAGSDSAPKSGSDPLPEAAPEYPPDLINPRHDPLGALAQAAGYSDRERWWEHMVEQRQDSTDLFAAILEAMTALRAELPPADDALEEQREAYMRQAIRAALHEGFARIAVVCGAWHAPALATLPPAQQDTATLKGLPKTKTQATWVPWTYSRLSYTTGYGAGIESPGWYQHLWSHQEQVVIRWMTRVARLLREEGLDASSAHSIEAVRLAETLAALRGHPLPGLPELTEAIQTVFCFGSPLPLRLIHEQMIVGDIMGVVPSETPMVPLQRDLERQQKRLKLPMHTTYDAKKPLDLDLRKELDLERSHLLHRLDLLDIPWGKTERISRQVRGTFHELWR
ncbi:MAG: periplasmic heavy metal sensor, partial [Chloroflexaceae bacterium]|nr:periplasmic heavy metal sensor [Chloroflexaceae bacterium]